MTNQIIIVGRLVHDCVEYATTDEKFFTTFTIANNENKEKVNFIDCKAFGEIGKAIKRYCKKGSLVLVKGKLRQEKYQTKDQENRSKYVVIVDSIDFLSNTETGKSE